jgi:hypothetical protein
MAAAMTGRQIDPAGDETLQLFSRHERPGADLD